MAISPTEVSDAILQVGSFVVMIGSHQWDFTDGVQFYGHTQQGSDGVETFQPYGVDARVREVRFVKATALIEAFRELSYRAGLTGTLVKFIPDAAVPGTFWWVNWPTELTVEMVQEGRFEVRVRFAEQASAVA